MFLTSSETQSDPIPLPSLTLYHALIRSLYLRYDFSPVTVRYVETKDCSLKQVASEFYQSLPDHSPAGSVEQCAIFQNRCNLVRIGNATGVVSRVTEGDEWPDFSGPVQYCLSVLHQIYKRIYIYIYLLISLADAPRSECRILLTKPLLLWSKAASCSIS